MSPEACAAQLREAGVARAWLLRSEADGRLQSSHPALAELAAFVEQAEDYAEHEAIFLAVGPESGALFGAFLHDTRRGQAQGGLRHAPYPRMDAFLRDGLRLSRDMGRKCALAGLWWGGGKGLIGRGGGALTLGARATLYREYGDFVSSLRGCYVTAEDAGTRPEDVARVFERSRFTTCIPPARGGSGNPSAATAAGVLCAMQAGLGELGRGGLAGKRVVVQGLGQVGSALVEALLEHGVGQLVAGDIDAGRCEALAARHPGVELRPLAPDDTRLLGEPCDVLAPCALGGVLGPESIPRLQTGLVCGAANNQLLDDARDARALADRGIDYLPDFLVNRMGIVRCANEQYGSFEADPGVLRHLDPEVADSIPSLVVRLLREASRQGSTPWAVAVELADRRSHDLHPIWGHRSAAIVASLVRAGWHREPTDGPQP